MAKDKSAFGPKVEEAKNTSPTENPQETGSSDDSLPKPNLMQFEKWLYDWHREEFDTLHTKKGKEMVPAMEAALKKHIAEQEAIIEKVSSDYPGNLINEIGGKHLEQKNHAIYNLAFMKQAEAELSGQKPEASATNGAAQSTKTDAEWTAIAMNRFATFKDWNDKAKFDAIDKQARDDYKFEGGIKQANWAATVLHAADSKDMHDLMQAAAKDYQDKKGQDIYKGLDPKKDDITKTFLDAQIKAGTGTNGHTVADSIRATASAAPNSLDPEGQPSDATSRSRVDYSLASQDNFGKDPEWAKTLTANMEKVVDKNGKLYAEYDDVKNAATASERTIRIMQHNLHDNGHPDLDVDGKMGPLTRQAFKAWLKSDTDAYKGSAVYDGPINGDPLTAKEIGAMKIRMSMDPAVDSQMTGKPATAQVAAKETAPTQPAQEQKPDPSPPTVQPTPQAPASPNGPLSTSAGPTGAHSPNRLFLKSNLATEQPESMPFGTEKKPWVGKTADGVNIKRWISAEGGQVTVAEQDRVLDDGKRHHVTDTAVVGSDGALRETHSVGKDRILTSKKEIWSVDQDKDGNVTSDRELDAKGKPKETVAQAQQKQQQQVASRRSPGSSPGQ